MISPRFLNFGDIKLRYKDAGYDLLKVIEGENSTTYCLKKDVRNVDSRDRSKKATVFVNVTSTTKMKKDGSSYGTVITEIEFPTVIRDKEIRIKDISFEYDRTPEGLVLIGYEKNESSRKMF